MPSFRDLFSRLKRLEKGGPGGRLVRVKKRLRIPHQDGTPDDEYCWIPESQANGPRIEIKTYDDRFYNEDGTPRVDRVFNPDGTPYIAPYQSDEADT